VHLARGIDVKIGLKAKERMARLHTTASEAVEKSLKRLEVVKQQGAEAVERVKQHGAQAVERYRPSDQEVEAFREAATKGAKATADAAAVLGKQLVGSKLFKDAAKGAGAGAVIAVPVPVIGPMLGALIGAGVGIYVGQKFDGAGDIEVKPVTGLERLEVSLASLKKLREEGALSEEEFRQLKKKVIDSFGETQSSPR
jgi:hypothetical protein